MPDDGPTVVPVNILCDEDHDLSSACFVLAHEKAIYQWYSDRYERKNVNRTSSVKYKQPEDVEEQQDYKNYPGHDPSKLGTRTCRPH